MSSPPFDHTHANHLAYQDDEESAQMKADSKKEKLVLLGGGWGSGEQSFYLLKQTAKKYDSWRSQKSGSWTIPRNGGRS